MEFALKRKFNSTFKREINMGSVRPYGRHRAEVIDIHFEMNHWKNSYGSLRFVASNHSFSRYEHAFRFAYDAYLANHNLALAQIEPLLIKKYFGQFDEWTRLPQQDVASILREIWTRLGGSLLEERSSSLAPHVDSASHKNY